MRRRLALGLGGLLLLPPLLLLALRAGFLTPLFNLALSRGLGSGSPLQARVGRVRSDVLSFIEADDVLVLAPSHGSLLPLLTVGSLRVEYDGWQAWRGRIDWQDAIRLARVRGLNVFLLRPAGGDWNVSALTQMKKPAPRADKPRAPLPLPATRLELEDSQVVLNDESRAFRASIDGLEGTLDTRALPLVAYSLSGRTDGHARENLSLAGELDRATGAHSARLDLDNVELARYLNYFLPPGGLAFTGGRASLNVRLRKAPGGQMQASGRAELHGGTLRIPAINQPLEALSGAVTFDPGSLRFRQAQARFLGADWRASGSIVDLRHPAFQLRIQGDQVPLQALSEQVKGLGLLRLSGTAAVDADLSGPARRPLVRARVWSPQMSIGGALLEGLSASAQLQGGRLQVEGLRAMLWGGPLTGSADLGLGKGGRLKAQLAVEGARLQQATLDGRRPLPLSGTASVSLKGSGLLRDPDLELSLSLPHAALGSLDLGSLDGRAQWGPGGLDAHFQALRGRLTGRVAFTRGPGAAFHHSLITLRSMDLSSTAAGLASAGDSVALPAGAVKAGALLKDRLRGTVDATVTLEGPLRSRQLWVDAALKDGRLMLAPDGPLALRDPEAGLPLHLLGAVGLHNGDIQFGRPNVPLKAVLGGHKGGSLDVQALGRYPLRGAGLPGHLALDLAGDLRLLDALSLFNKTQGRLSGDFVLAGTPDAPSADGEVRISGFQSDPEAYLAPLRGGQLTVQMRGQDVHLVGLKFQAGGQVNAVGEVSLAQGLGGLSGRLELRTDDQGLRLQNWDSVGSGSVRLEPLVIGVDGPDSPLSISGRVLLSDAQVVYGGPARQVQQKDLVRATRPVSLDLRVALGSNVWYDKHQTQTVNLLDFDPLKWGNDALGSMTDTLQRPDIYFRLAPTDVDFRITGTTPDVELTGELGIDRGRLTIMENEFQFKPEREPARIRFNGRHAEVRAGAVGRLRYTRDDPVTHRPRQKTVEVTVQVSPMDDDSLARSNLAKAFLNYQLTFSADPPLVPGDDQTNQLAILNLLVLGDPMVDADSANAENNYMGTQVDRILSAELRKEIAKVSQQGFKLVGSRFIDVLRVVPRFKYQGAATSSAANGNVQQSSDSSLTFSDVTTEMGWSLGDKLYASLQGVGYFDSESLNTVVAGMPSGTTYEVQPWGLRAGFEYQVSPNRTLEAYYNYAVNDDLDPMPYMAGSAPPAGPGIRLRNTIPVGNYGEDLARRRRYDLEGIQP
jgi:hypothetical protein